MANKNNDPFQDNPLSEVLEKMSDKQLMMNMIKNMNYNDLSNLMEWLEERCSEATLNKWLDVYRSLQIKW